MIAAGSPLMPRVLVELSADIDDNVEEDRFIRGSVSRPLSGATKAKALLRKSAAEADMVGLSRRLGEMSNC
jgi:hypothetical protein